MPSQLYPFQINSVLVWSSSFGSTGAQSAMHCSNLNAGVSLHLIEHSALLKPKSLQSPWVIRPCTPRPSMDARKRDGARILKWKREADGFLMCSVLTTQDSVRSCDRCKIVGLASEL